MPWDGSETAGAFDRVPTEMRAWHQWVCWRYGAAPSGKPTKIPIQSANGREAKVNDPGTWGSYAAAVAAVAAELWGSAGIGFVFGPDDPYAGIDLDDTKGDADLLDWHGRVFNAVQSYAERSPSGLGLHIIVRGTVPDGLRSDAFAVEIYSSGRFFTMTGDVYRDVPIAACQEVLTVLYGKLRAVVGKRRDHAAGTALLNAAVATQDDDTLWAAAMASPNGPKLDRLARGDASDMPAGQDQSGSGIDLALCNVIQHFTKDPDQIERLWRATPHAMGRAKKMERTAYVKRTIGLAFDREIPAVDHAALYAAWDAKRAIEKAPTEREDETPTAATDTGEALRQNAAGADPYALPPGLMGEIANFIYRSAPRQVQEIALAGAIGLMAGLCGRAYNVNGAGLNLYIALLASSGSGKEAISDGYSALEEAVRKAVPCISDFMGPADFASPQGLLKAVARQRSAVSLVGEFGGWLDQMVGDRPNPVRAAIKTQLLLLYGKSGKRGLYRQTVYSDKDHNISEIKSPALTLVGESTPSTFYRNITEKVIEDGFLPRFIIIEYEGIAQYINERAQHEAVSPSLAENLAQLATRCLGLNAHSDGPHSVDIDDEARELLRGYSRFCTDKANASDTDDLKSIWSRAYVNVVKLAALVAIGCNQITPLILARNVQWAIGLVSHSVEKVVAKLASGEIAGSPEARQYAELMRCLRELPQQPDDKLASYGLTVAMRNAGVVNRLWLNRKVSRLSAYRQDRLGEAAALKRAITRATDEQALTPIRRDDEFLKLHQISSECFTVNRHALR